MMRAQVNALFACRHEVTVHVDVDDDTEIPATVRGLGKCPACLGDENLIAVSSIAPKPGGREIVLDAVQMFAL